SRVTVESSVMRAKQKVRRHGGPAQNGPPLPRGPEETGGRAHCAKRGLMKRAFAAIVAASIIVPSASAGAVEIQCAKHDQLVGLLAKKYREKPVAMGSVTDERFMQLFVSSKGTWTMLMTRTDGQACIVAA